MAYTETPRADGDTSYLTNGHNLENFSAEQSLLSPIKKHADHIVSGLRNGRANALKTPRARAPLAERQNLPGASGRGEFTPLLQSVARKNLERNSKLKGAPETPAFLKENHKATNSPALPGVDVSNVYGSDFGSSVLAQDEGTLLPQVVSSSAQSTPLATLPKDSKGILLDQGNILTLKEQENVCPLMRSLKHFILG